MQSPGSCRMSSACLSVDDAHRTALGARPFGDAEHATFAAGSAQADLHLTTPTQGGASFDSHRQLLANAAIAPSSGYDDAGGASHSLRSRRMSQVMRPFSAPLTNSANFFRA